MQFTDTEALVPLGLLAAEHDQPVEQFAAWLQRRGITITVSTGLRCITAEVAQRLYDEREATRRAAADERRRRAGELNPVHARIAAHTRRQAELRAAGLELDGLALLQVASGDLDPEADAQRAGEELMARGLDEALAPPRPPSKPASPFEQLGLRR
ncbi:hypothetical protein [Mycobacterium saskatchewanense]|uniref:Uncharacterized protein n=1 Tax=Mycobacterium saskatchewanense TaxID=220927 RepID=A0AAJ3NNY6_9MYCO|nr:hypothetical protein [Mycobacterium saskatchewanense]ORW70669.1 hypothetical protein AWC23_16450 [Mycobacterium saskatchewanense]